MCRCVQVPLEDKVSDALELEFQVVGSHLMCMLGTELGFSDKEDRVSATQPSLQAHVTSFCLVFQDRVSLCCSGCPGTQISTCLCLWDLRVCHHHLAHVISL